MSFWKLTIASLKMFIRNRQALFWSLAFPSIFITIFGLITFEGSGTFSLGLVDKAKNNLSNAVIQTLEKMDNFEITKGSEEEETKALEEAKRTLVIIFPQDFGKEKPSKVTVYYQQGKEQFSQPAAAIVDKVLTGLSYQISQTSPLFALEQKPIEAKDLGYINFLVPGIIAMTIMQMGVIGVSSVIVSYREKGVLKRLLATPLNPTQFLASQVVERLVTSILQTSLLLLFSVLLFDVKIVGNLLLLFLLAVLGGVVFLVFGFAISGIAKTTDAAHAMAQVISMPMMFLSGIFFPFESMPDWLARYARYLPLSYLGDGFRLVMNEGAGLLAIKNDALILLLWGFLAFLVAIKLYRWE